MLRLLRSVGVVLDLVLFSQQLGLLYLGEHLNVQEFIPEQACDVFHKWVPAGQPAGM